MGAGEIFPNIERRTDAYLRYQGESLGIDFSFARSTGIMPDTSQVSIPPGKKIILPEIKAEIEVPAYPSEGYPRTRLPLSMDPSGKLLMGDRASLTSLESTYVELDNIYISGDGVVEELDVVSFDPEGQPEKTFTKLNLVDFRWRWEDCGFVVGDRNVVSTPDEEPFVILDGICYKMRTLRPGAVAGKINEFSDSARLKIAKEKSVSLFFDPTEKIKLLKQSPTLGVSPLKEIVSNGSGQLWTAGDLISECLLSLEGINGVFYYPEAQKRVISSYPEDITWGSGKRAAVALRELLDLYDLDIAIGTVKQDVAYVFIRGEKQELPSVIKKYLSQERYGLKFNIPPDAVTVAGEPSLFEIMCFSYDYVMEDEDGKVRPMYNIITEWGLNMTQVATALLHSDESERFKTFFEELESDVKNKRRSILKRCAFKWLRLPGGYRLTGKLQDLMSLDDKRFLTKKDLQIGASILLPKESKQLLRNGSWNCQYFYNAMDYVSSIDRTEHIIKFTEPVVLVIPSGQGLDEKAFKNKFQALKAKAEKIKQYIRTAMIDAAKENSDIERMIIDLRIKLANLYLQSWPLRTAEAERISSAAQPKVYYDLYTAAGQVAGQGWRYLGRREWLVVEAELNAYLAKQKAKADGWLKRIKLMNEQLEDINKELYNMEEPEVMPGLFAIKFAGQLPIDGPGRYFSVTFGPLNPDTKRTALIKTKLFKYIDVDRKSNEESLLKEAGRLALKYYEELSASANGEIILKGFHAIDCGPLVKRVEWKTGSNGEALTSVYLNKGKPKLTTPLPLYKGPKDESTR